MVYEGIPQQASESYCEVSVVVKARSQDRSCAISPSDDPTARESKRVMVARCLSERGDWPLLRTVLASRPPASANLAPLLSFPQCCPFW